MENAIDALKMAAATLIFIIAIGTSFSIFGKAKQTADSIITMRDKQAYLAAAELDNGILYTSSSAIQGETGLTADDVKTKFGVTTTGDRIVNINDIVSTLYRYSKEKYGVTIVKSNGDVLRRFDSATESLIINYKKIESDDDDDIDKYKNRLKKNTTTIYAEPDFSDLEGLYRVSVTGGSGNISCGAPWYGNDDEINRRIACELSGKTYTYNGQSFQRSSLLTELKNNTIVEVINEIDESKYLKEDTDGDGIEETTDLLQQYNMPTIEIVYIIL